MRMYSMIAAFMLYYLVAVHAFPDQAPLLVGSGSLEHHSFRARAPASDVTQDMNMITDPDGELSSEMTGIFYKNGLQTYCEVAICNQNTGIIAASCLDYTNGVVDTTFAYGVAVASTDPSGPGSVLTVGTPIPHPSYNPNTYANNIAVLPLSSSSSSTFTKDIDDWPAGWNYYILNHRSVDNNYTNEIIFQRAIETSGEESNQDTQGCTDASAVFGDNPSDYICNNATIPSYLNPSCQAPYGSVYGVTGIQVLTLGGLFSHSAIYSDQGYCGQGKLYNYYILLRNYVPWIESVATGPINTYHSEYATGYTAPANVTYTMTDPDNNIVGVALVGDVNTSAVPEDSSSEVSSAVVSSSEPTSVDNITSVESPTDEIESSNSVVSSTESASETTTESASETTTELTSESTAEPTSETMTVSETSTISTTDVFSQTSVQLTTSTVLVTMTSVEVEMTTLTNTLIDPSVIFATDSVISAVVAFVTDVSILTVGNGQVVTQTVTEQETVTVTGDSDGLEAMDGETTTVTETVTETVTAATNTVYVTNTVTESAPTVTSVSTVTFTDLGFITITATDTLVSTVTALSTTSTSSSSAVPSSSSALSASSESSSVDGSSSEANANKYSTGIPLWMIVLLAILCLLLLILIVWLILYRRRRQREKKQEAMLAFGAPMQLPQKRRVANWLYGRIWGRPLSRRESPPEYMSTIG